MKMITALLALIVFTTFADSKTKTVFHNLLWFESDIDVVDWNVDTSNLSPDYVIETIDSVGRVVKLQFMHKGKLVPQSCAIIPIITYEYFDDRIVQKSYREKNKVYTILECGAFQKTIYFLANDSVSTCLNFHTNISFLKKPTKKDSENYRYFYNDMIQYKTGKAGSCLGIMGYSFSMAKFKGRDPGKKPW